MEQTTINVPTIFLVLFIIAVSIIGACIRCNKKKENGGDINIDDYLPDILKAVQKAVEILMINMNSFDTKDEYMKSVISTTIEYIKQNSASLGIPKEVITMINVDVLSDYIAKIISTNYFQCFENVTPMMVSAHSQLFEEEFVKCYCGIPGCECNEGECTYSETNYTDEVEKYDENGNKIITYDNISTTNEATDDKD